MLVAVSLEDHETRSGSRRCQVGVIRNCGTKQPRTLVTGGEKRKSFLGFIFYDTIQNWFSPGSKILSI